MKLKDLTLLNIRSYTGVCIFVRTKLNDDKFYKSHRITPPYIVNDIDEQIEKSFNNMTPFRIYIRSHLIEKIEVRFFETGAKVTHETFTNHRSIYSLVEYIKIKDFNDFELKNLKLSHIMDTI